jgi:hypothetical protein
MPELDTAQLLALAAALGWASGIRLYLVVLLTGLAGYQGWIALPGGLSLLQHPGVLGAAAFMVFVEFFADKIAGLDTLWDVVHTVVRIPAGAALAAAVFGADGGAMALMASIIGGTLAATSHAAKTTGRAALNTSPEPFSNIAASVVEEAVVTGGLWLAVKQPLLFAAALALVLVLSVWLIVKCLRFFRAVITRVIRIFSGKTDPGVNSVFKGKPSRALPGPSDASMHNVDVTTK